MGAYVRIFRFTVEHHFFADGLCRNMRFFPIAQSMKICRDRDLLIRQEVNGFSVFCEEGKRSELQAEATDPLQGLRLSWLAYSDDPYFVQYTQALASSSDKILVFDNLQAIPNADGRARLHVSDYVSTADWKDIDRPELSDMLDRQALLRRPAFIVSFSMTNKEQTSSSDCYVHFAARTSYWKYYINDSMSVKELTIVDAEGKADFSPTEKEQLGGGQSLVFMSSIAIPMQERHVQRFQLRERGIWGEKVVIKRLPNASLNRISMQTIDGEAALVSEMYIG